MEPLTGLAAAYAQTGRFADAAASALRAMNLARATGNHALAKSLLRQIEVYQAQAVLAPGNPAIGGTK